MNDTDPTNDTDWLAQRFEEHRPRLAAVAQRMLGSASEADDAVQEAWIRLSRTNADSIDNLGGWLTTVLSRVCLNTLQARRARGEVPLDDAPDAAAAAAGPDVAAPTGAAPSAAPDPEGEAMLAESVGLALLVVLDKLSPAERVSFVLHDMFGVPFDEIAPIVGREGAATRQLASRARRRVRGEDVDGEPDRLRHAKLVDAFLAAAREGDLDPLLGLLDPDVVLRADPTAEQMGAAPEIRGAVDVARFSRRARGATPAFLDGAAAAAWLLGGELRVVYRFTVRDDRIAAIDLIADPERLSGLDLVIAGD